jgi:hypothetical protein
MVFRYVCSLKARTATSKIADWTKNSSTLSEVTRQKILQVRARLGAASLSIKPFEVSRWRLRRTRQLPVCVFNRVLVLKWDFAAGLNDPVEGLWAGREGVIFASQTRAMRGDGVTAIAQTHFHPPGSPARVASQEKELLRSYPVHGAGWPGNAVTRGAQ